MDELTAALEGLVFLSGDEGLSLLQLQSALQDTERKTIEERLKAIQEEYGRPNHGMELVEYGGRWRFVTKESIHPYGMKLYASQQSPALSQAAMETLAVIAYRQPITRAEIEEIRGVGSDTILRKLQAKGLVEAKDRLDAVGKPLLYKVTPAFMDAFALQSLEELPDLEAPVQQDLFEQNQEI